ncbi:hypothetical protein Bhyg_13323 [Pseudolycoriella hygida]|uniref:Serum response factor-binding protein 1 n=1 Tax=Pseudolycoriella hygida TaxID=35572 RepID=A0A9Q0MPY9_9DIPT|nr:hypothetical protein Bhyg_13323 [Pseudolycoriella hygida]
MTAFSPFSPFVVTFPTHGVFVYNSVKRYSCVYVHNLLSQNFNIKMTEKRDLNNELILMKTHLQRAKVCTIRKLVRKLKSLSTRQGQEQNGLKLIGKRSRLTGQIDYLKKIRNLELAKLALGFAKNPNKILTNQLSSIEDTSLANIVTFKCVNEKLQQIKSKFGLDDSDGWRDSVQEIGKKKKKKIDKETNKMRNKERKEAKKKHSELVKKRDEWLENAYKSDGTSETDEDEVLDKGADKPKKSVHVREKKLKKVLVKNALSDPLKTVDSFFVTETGENYLATKVVDRIQSRGPNDGLDRKKRRAQQFGRMSVTNSIRKEAPIPKDPSHRSVKRKVNSSDKFKSKKLKSDEEVMVDSTADTTEKIHPSWAAKQKLKPVISKFLGSKITFDD